MNKSYEELLNLIRVGYPLFKHEYLHPPFSIYVFFIV
jgi:hypothetical protein